MKVKHLKNILNELDDELEVVTENVQDGINRHNEIVGWEDDPSDEFFVLKIDNEAKTEKDNLAKALIEYLERQPILTEEQESLLNHACLELGLM